VSFQLPRESIETLAGPLSDAQAESLTEYGSAIISASRNVNLVSRRSLENLPEHFVDSAALLKFLEPGERGLGDLGSGAGFPGMVVAILRPSVDVTLVDSRRSKVVFLKDVKRRLQLKNVSVSHGRVQDLAGEPELGLATARALGSLEDVLAPCLRLVSGGGRLVLFKGPLWAQEAERGREIAAAEGAEITRTEAVELPGLGRATTFVEFHVKQLADT
jgi:16S rRNA (guanine527-N7)-methyltransferase